MVKNGSYSVVEKLLISALELEDKGNRPFTAENLVVKAWQNFPDTFGLAGYLDENGIACYPDSNRVYSEIMGSKPIRKKGYLRKVGTKMYQLTEAGIDNARLISRSFFGVTSDNTEIEKTGLGREIKHQLKKLFSSKAVEKYKEKRFDEITFYDACAFWGISPRSSAIQLEGGISNLRNVVESVLKDTRGKKFVLEHGGYPYSKKDLEGLFHIHDTLINKFEKQLYFIKKRTTERKKGLRG